VSFYKLVSVANATTHNNFGLILFFEEVEARFYPLSKKMLVKHIR
jgi:hypothetical protein